MTALKELAQKAQQGAQMAEEDLLALYKLLCIKNPLGAITVLRTLEKFRQVNQELAMIASVVDWHQEAGRK